MEYLKTLLEEGFDPAALLPDINHMLDKIDLLVRAAVMIGPVVLLIMGVIYLVCPPKEANHFLGYQFFWGKNSVEAWRFTQKVAGIGWCILGLVLTVAMYVISGGFAAKDAVDVVSTAAHCIIWELVLVAVSCLAVDGVVMAFYDRKGQRRKRKD